MKTEKFQELLKTINDVACESNKLTKTAIVSWQNGDGEIEPFALAMLKKIKTELGAVHQIISDAPNKHDAHYKCNLCQKRTPFEGKRAGLDVCKRTLESGAICAGVKIFIHAKGESA